MRLSKESARSIGFYADAWTLPFKIKFHGKYERTWKLFYQESNSGYFLKWNSKLQPCIPGQAYDLDRSVPVYTTEVVLKIMSLYG